MHFMPNTCITGFPSTYDPIDIYYIIVNGQVTSILQFTIVIFFTAKQPVDSLNIVLKQKSNM